MKPANSNKPTAKKHYENAAWQVKSLICGVDEVGRGCLAGPVVTAAVILYKNSHHPLLKDSKKLSQKEREECAQWIVKNSWYGYGILEPHMIDKHNIYQATIIAMKRSITQVMSQCNGTVSHILIDAVSIKFQTSWTEATIYHAPKGEDWSCSIAAASIIAKVKRDALMEKLDRVFPEYRLCQHKGYATNIHCNALRYMGATLIHRSSFLKKILIKDTDDHNQTRIC